MNVNATSRALHYGRSTVLYHLIMVYKITGLDPLNFWQLCKLIKLIDEGEIYNYREHGE